jgi:RNA polymerase sigma factor for flagellar operon FliA
VVPGEPASSTQALVEANLDLARRAARMIHPRVRDHVELDELMSLAILGLTEAAARFDPDGGASFRTFAWYRVHGAVMDGLRKASNLPRRVWAKLVALRAASEYLESAGAREAGARAAGAPPPSTTQTVREISNALSAIRTMYLTSLAPIIGTEEEPAGDHVPADEGLDRARFAARLDRAIAALPDRERTLVTKHYYEGKNLMEAGAELGISKSWASRLHAQAVDKLRAALDDDG